LVKQYRKLFAMEGVELEFREHALQAIAKRALERRTGARGLRSIIEHALLDIMFDLPSLTNVQKVVVDEIAVAGLSFVPITPFEMKDWERWDDGGEESPARLEGTVSRNGHLAPYRFDPDERVPTIAEALDSLAGRTDPTRTRFVFHSPPRDTACDRTRLGTHVGSRAIRRFIETHQPPLVLSGHATHHEGQSKRNQTCQYDASLVGHHSVLGLLGPQSTVFAATLNSIVDL
jgi:hypothetical protein